MDGATIFIYVLSAVFFTFIIYLGVTSRRKAAKAEPDIQSESPREHPRKAA